MRTWDFVPHFTERTWHPEGKCKEIQMNANLKKILFVAVLGLVTLPTFASQKPRDDHRAPTPAVKSHLAKLHFGR
jgi:hypothetical protein